MSPHAWRRQGPRKPSSCAAFTPNSHWGRAATRKKSLASMHAGSLRSCLTLCHPVDCGLPGFSVRQRVFSSQEYLSIMANTGCHTLLEHCLSCYRAANPPEYLVLPEPLRTRSATAPPYLALPGAHPTSRAASGAPTCRGGNKTTAETQGQCG